MNNWLTSTLLAGALVVLTACSTPPFERTGGAVDIFPVTHKYSLSFAESSLEDAQTDMKAFIKKNLRTVLSNDMKLLYSSPKGKALAKYAESYLHSIGYNPQRLVLIERENQTHFDFELTLEDFQVQVNECEKAGIGHYFVSDNGCYSENVRWLSMENPEKMLPSKSSFSSAEIKE